MMALKLASLAQGASGVRPGTPSICSKPCWRTTLMPVVPGAGFGRRVGDLAPLAHMTAAMIGVGEIYRRPARLPAAEGACATPASRR